MFGCWHPWSKLKLKLDGIECEDCEQQWEGEGLEMLFLTASAEMKALHQRIDYMKEALEETLSLWSCRVCGKFYSKLSKQQGFNYFEYHVCRECVPKWYFIEPKVWPEPDRKYMRNHLGRWLSEYAYPSEWTLKIWKELEAEIINARGNRRAAWAVQ